MTQVRQFYGATGVPMSVPGEPEEIADAWRSHRRRLRAWFSSLDEDGWSADTRCSAWRVSELAEHLVSGAQFLGFTLHQACKGTPSRLLEGFDAQETPANAALQFRGLSTAELLDRLTDMDARLDAEMAAVAAAGWDAPAEGPLGQIPAYVAVNHFLFDSWVHERDLMLPAGQTPETDPTEAAVVTSYVMALTGVAQAADGEPAAATTLRIALTDIDRTLQVDASPEGTGVIFADNGGRVNVTATAGALVDVATGRTTADAFEADAVAKGYLTRLAAVMA
jgi:uncharacterized protein (TIGR03083 family)